MCETCNNEGLIETAQVGIETASECAIEKCDDCNVFSSDDEAMEAWTKKMDILDLF
ncbi:MAG: hypothetical protein P8J32_04550 [bacterium]|nr:hypothetical protein [bacterium]